jgi:hypothetical protein
VAIRRLERRQKSEVAQVTDTSANLNPIVIFVVRLFPPATVTDD